MPYDAHDGSGNDYSGTTMKSYEGGQQAQDPTEIFIPHIEPEDDEALLFRPHAEREDHTSSRAQSGSDPEPMNPLALGALIDRQARGRNIDGLLDVRREPARLSLSIDVIKSIVVEPSKQAGELVKARLEKVRHTRPFLPLQSSANTYGELRKLFDQGLQPAVGLSTNWEVVSSSQSSIVTATEDLARYYGLRDAREEHGPGAQRKGTVEAGADLVPQDRNDLREALGDLREETGVKIVNLFNDWRMWLTWLHAGHPIICLGALGESLRKGTPGKTKPDAVKPHFKHAFILAGYELTEQDIVTVARDIGAGQRGIIDVPVIMIVRNSWNAGWGERGHLKIPFADFHNQFRDAYGLQLGDEFQPR
jgi:hypothetical protein